MMTAPNELTNAHGAVMATKPANMPLHIMAGSGLPVLNIMNRAANNAPDADASIVFTATTAIRLSVPASVDPGLNPNQPNARIKVPNITMGMSWPGIGLGFPSGPNLPNRAPMTQAPARAIMPPVWCTTDE